MMAGKYPRPPGKEQGGASIAAGRPPAPLLRERGVQRGRRLLEPDLREVPACATSVAPGIR